MIQATKFRKSPPVCLFISLARLLIGKFRLSNRYVKHLVKMEDGQVFTVFRHITVCPVEEIEHASIFIVRFKFARLSHNLNKIASVIPMLMITGYPGFQVKMYAVNKENGFWQGMYQWKTSKHLEEYLCSFVYKAMNSRALKDTVSSTTYGNQTLMDYMDKNKIV